LRRGGHASTPPHLAHLACHYGETADDGPGVGEKLTPDQAERFMQSKRDVAEKIRALQRLTARAAHDKVRDSTEEVRPSHALPTVEHGGDASSKKPLQSLRDVMQHLTSIGDKSRILTVRRVRRLGAKPHELLTKYFQSWGLVQGVFTYFVFKAQCGKNPRMGDMAFVLMATSADAQRCLSHAPVALNQSLEILPFDITSGRPAGSR